MHPSKRKGNGFERELVTTAQRYGLPAERAYASNGRALGHSETVDCVIGGCTVQAKRRKQLPLLYNPTAHDVDAVAIRADHGPALVVIRYEHWLELLRAQQPANNTTIGAEPGNGSAGGG